MEGGFSIGRVAVLAGCVAGIWAAYVYQGVLQEILSTKKFGPDGRRFEHLTFLGLAQNVVCFVWSFISLWLLGWHIHSFVLLLLPSASSSVLLIWSPNRQSQAPLWTFWSASISNSVGPACGILALKYISYPAQVLAKSSKMIPVMLMGAIVYGVRYTLPEYLCTFLVAGGVATFALFKSSSKAISKIASPNAPLGYSLCFINLGLDGFTNATQDAITHRYPKTSAWHIMLGMNFWGSIYMALYMFLLTNGGHEAIQFCKDHPEAFWDILMFCLCGAVGQNFIFLTISRFGALTNTTITTTRKFVSILVSALWNGNPLTSEQWTGVGMVFAGLSYQILLKYQRRKVKGSFKTDTVAAKQA